jgi:hypothetical protein
MVDTNGNQVKSSDSESVVLHRLEVAVEEITGQPAETLRQQTLTELRRRTEARTKTKMLFRSRFPLIGRGNVMRDKVRDHKFVEAQLQEALK